jgi:hypothetical protein
LRLSIVARLRDIGCMKRPKSKLDHLLVTTREAAELACVTPECIRQWISSNDLDYFYDQRLRCFLVTIGALRRAVLKKRGILSNALRFFATPQGPSVLSSPSSHEVMKCRSTKRQNVKSEKSNKSRPAAVR